MIINNTKRKNINIVKMMKKNRHKNVINVGKDKVKNEE